MKNKSAIFSVLLAGLLLPLLFSCKKEIPSTIPTVTVKSVTNITATTATSGGEITSNGGATVTARGVCWSINQNPTIDGNITNDGSGSGSFTSSITGLTAGITFYLKAYATNEVGTAYSNQTTFSALAMLPVLLTNDILEATSTSIRTGGIILSDGGSAITAEGVCWSTSPSPTISDSKTMDGTSTKFFSSTITSLEPNTTYYIRSYATNSIGTAYGNELNTTTLAPPIPTIIAYKTTLQYNSNGNNTEVVEYVMYLNTNTWVNSSKEIYSYNSQGHKTQLIHSNWDTSTQSWINNYLNTFSYFAFGKMWLGTEYIWDTNTNAWMEFHKYDNYIINSTALYRTYYLWDTRGYWHEYNKYQYIFTFDTNGRIIKQTINAYDEDQYGYYGSSSTSYFTYDQQGNIIHTGESITYDTNGYRVEMIYEIWDSDLSKYVVSSKTTYKYDSNGNLTEYITNIY